MKNQQIPKSGVTRGHASMTAIRLRSAWIDESTDDNPADDNPADDKRAEEPRFRFHTVLNDKSVGTVGIRTGSTYDDAAQC